MTPMKKIRFLGSNKREERKKLRKIVHMLIDYACLDYKRCNLTTDASSTVRNVI